jgi:hypothetical protein
MFNPSAIGDAVTAKLAEQIRELRRNTIHDIVTIGRILVEARERLTRGQWLPWLRLEFSWSRQSADNFIHAYELSRDAELPTISNLPNLDPTALYLIARKSTPPQARVEVLKQAMDGHVSSAQARQIVSGFKSRPRKEKSKPLKPDLAAELRRVLQTIADIATKSSAPVMAGQLNSDADIGLINASLKFVTALQQILNDPDTADRVKLTTLIAETKKAEKLRMGSVNLMRLMESVVEKTSASQRTLLLRGVFGAEAKRVVERIMEQHRKPHRE